MLKFSLTSKGSIECERANIYMRKSEEILHNIVISFSTLVF